MRPEQKTNRLIREKSPYLRQHACNPVDWHPWGEEAWRRARREQKPVFLSIGYSTCHWCHVMEKESFQDPEVARLLNDSFVAIKVDREERPDLDQFYMQVCQRLTGSGGWPLTLVLTPERKPFFSGTYFPRERRFGKIGLLELLPRLREIWESRRSEVLHSAEEISALFRENPVPAGENRLDERALDETFRLLSSDFDGENGGFGQAPKFPSPHHIAFLLRFWKRRGEPHALEMAEQSLAAMRLGGIYDQVGFGFHRYSTDTRWLVPHFEKMLYDQALLAMAYTEAWQATGKDEYGRTALETLHYVLRDLVSPGGGFFTAEDADSEGEEGKFYIWTEGEVEKALAVSGEGRGAAEGGGSDVEFVRRLYGLKPEGNFDEVGVAGSGRNIFYLKRSRQALAVEGGMTAAELESRLERVRGRLLSFREKRPRPLRDEKILTDWNGLMIAALALAGRAFGEPDFTEAARRAADFILGTKAAGAEPDPDGLRPLSHVWIEGESKITGFLDDYAFFIWGLLELYETAFDVRYLQAALDLARYALRHFWDEAAGGFFFTPTGAADLSARGKVRYDGSVPSGNGVMFMNLLRLGRMSGIEEMEERAAQLAAAFSKEVTLFPKAFTRFLCGLDFALGPSAEVVVTADEPGTEARRFLKLLGEKFLPNVVVLFRPAGSEGGGLARIAPFAASLNASQGGAAAYVCSSGRCLPPAASPEEMMARLREALGFHEKTHDNRHA